jgi:hypothetical protein
LINENQTSPGKKSPRLSVESHDQAKNGVVASLHSAAPFTPRRNNLVSNRGKSETFKDLEVLLDEGRKFLLD